MQRLIESPPALQRTQRMAAATAKGVMPETGPYIPVGPWAVEIEVVRPAPVPAPWSGVPALVQREHHFRLGFARLGNAEPVAFYRPKKSASGAVRIVYGTSLEIRALKPRGPELQARRNRNWETSLTGTSRIPMAAPASSGQQAVTVESDWCRPAAATDQKNWKMAPRRWERPSRRLPISSELTAPPLPLTAGDTCRAVATPAADGLAWADRLAIPASRLASIPPPARPATEVEDEWDGLWEGMEASPLAALVAATGSSYPQPATLLPNYASGVRHLLPAAPEPLVPAALNAAWNADFSVPPTAVLEPLELTGSNLVATPVTRAGVVAPEWAGRIPARERRLDSLGMAASLQILALAEMDPVAPGQPLMLEAAWNTVDSLPSPPRRATAYGTRSLPAPESLVVPELWPATPSDDARPATAWLDVAFEEVLPSSRLKSAGRQIQLGDRVACRLIPDAAPASVTRAVPDAMAPPAILEFLPAVRGAQRAMRGGLCAMVPVDWKLQAVGNPCHSHAAETLLPLSRVRLPRHRPALSRGHERAGCLPVHPPRTATPDRKVPMAGGEGLCQPAAVPAPLKATRAGRLHKLPVRLFAVPGAQPMARPTSGGPIVWAMGEWASKPLICTSGLRPTSRRRKREKTRSALDVRGQITDLVSKIGVRDIWDKASKLPSDLKWIAMVVPLVIGIWTLSRPSQPESEKIAQTRPVAAPVEAAPSPEEPVTQTAAVKSPEWKNPPVAAEPEPVSVPQQQSAPAVLPASTNSSAWGSFTARIANRASVDLIEDFRSGLSNWEGRGEWSRSWSYDRAGTIRPGTLALFAPSTNLRDYVFEMKASIERRSIQWVVRASGPNNYHFVRLNVSPGAPLTSLELERWSVVNGRTGKVTRMPLPHAGANQTLFTIRVEARGDSITTYLQDQVIDTFNDPRLTDGGIGLVGAPDDRPRIYGIHVYHQNDFLGKLCSFLAPQPINSQGSD